jgi:large subunit ribosomal protein L33
MLILFSKGGFNMRAKIILVCTLCLSRNYQTTKQKFGVSDRFEVNKFCPKCAKHTLHKESK